MPEIIRAGEYSIPVIYEDNHLLVVEKPANLPTQADSSGDDDLLSILKRWIGEKYNKPGAVYLGLVHRLDRPVGGVMVFARTSKAASRLSETFRTHEQDRHYLAVVEGEIAGEMNLKDYLLKDGRTGMVRAVKKDTPRREGGPAHHPAAGIPGWAHADRCAALHRPQPPDPRAACPCGASAVGRYALWPRHAGPADCPVGLSSGVGSSHPA